MIIHALIVYSNYMNFRLSWQASLTPFMTTCLAQIRFAIPTPWHTVLRKQGLKFFPKTSNVSSSGRQSLPGAGTPGAADERRGEALRGGRQVYLVWIRGVNHVLWTRILKPAIMQRAGVQFDHPTGEQLSIYEFFWALNKTRPSLFRHFGGLLPSSSDWGRTYWIGTHSRTGLFLF